MFNLKLFVVGSCIVSSAIANNWVTTPLRLEIDPKLDRGHAVAVYEATGSAPEQFPEFIPIEGSSLVITSEKAPQIDSETGLYSKTYDISIPIEPVSGERQITLPYRIGGTGDAKDFILIVKTPELTLLSDRRLVWGRNAPADAQKVTVSLVSPEGYELTETVTIRGEAVAKIQRDAPHKYTIIVTPANTTVPGRSVINVKAVSKEGQKTSFVVYAEVK